MKRVFLGHLENPRAAFRHPIIDRLVLLAPLNPLDVATNFTGHWKMSRLRRGDIILQPPLIEIDYRVSPLDVVVALVPLPVLFATAEAMNHESDKPLSFRFVHRSRAPLLSSLAVELYDETDRSLPNGRFYMESLRYVFLGQIVKYYSEGQVRTFASSGTLTLDVRVRRALGFVDDHLGEEIGLQLIARQAGCSPARLAELLKEATGETIWQYVQRQRLNWADNLLCTTGYSVDKIADQVGYSSASHFATAFRAAFGMTPGRFRRANRS